MSRVKLLRILQHKPLRSHVPDLYLEFNTLPVTLLHEQQLVILAHKMIHHPEPAPELLIYYSNKMSLCILTTPELRMICISLGSILDTDLNVYCLKYKILKLWNEPPTELKEQTLNVFENDLKLYLITKLYNDN